MAEEQQESTRAVGRTVSGTVISDKGDKTITVRVERIEFARDLVGTAAREVRLVGVLRHHTEGLPFTRAADHDGDL